MLALQFRQTFHPAQLSLDLPGTGTDQRFQLAGGCFQLLLRSGQSIPKLIEFRFNGPQYLPYLAGMLLDGQRTEAHL